MVTWVENSDVQVGQTVKVKLILPEQTVVGVVDRIFNGKIIVDVGHKHQYVDRFAEIYTIQ